MEVATSSSVAMKVLVAKPILDCKANQELSVCQTLLSVVQTDHQCPGLKLIDFVLKSPLFETINDGWASVDHDCSSRIMAFSMVIFGNSLLESRALMYLRIALSRYFDFNDRITPWYKGCVTEVVFGGKTLRSMAVNPGTEHGCAEQLSTINATLQFNLRSNLRRSLVHPTFCLCLVHTQ